MKAKKILYYLCLIMVIITINFSCKDEIVSYEASPSSNPNSNKVYFPDQSSNQLVIAIDADSIGIKIARVLYTQELNVKIRLIGNKEFNIPQSINFPAGDSVEIFKLSVGNVELMKNYLVTLEVEETQTNPYDSAYNKNKFSTLSLNILKEDFAPYAHGTYVSGWEEDQWESDMEFSPATQQYRIKEFCGYKGFDAYFQWDGGNEITMVRGKKLGSRIGFQTGEIHSKYGMIWAIYDGPSGPEGDFNYNSETKTFTFGYAWRVTAGSFGVYPDTYTIANVY